MGDLKTHKRLPQKLVKRHELSQMERLHGVTLVKKNQQKHKVALSVHNF